MAGNSGNIGAQPSGNTPGNGGKLCPGGKNAGPTYWQQSKKKKTEGGRGSGVLEPVPCNEGKMQMTGGEGPKKKNFPRPCTGGAYLWGGEDTIRGASKEKKKIKELFGS